MKKHTCSRIMVLAAIIATLALVITGCPNPAGAGGSGDSVEPMPYPRVPAPEVTPDPSIDSAEIDGPATISAQPGETLTFVGRGVAINDPENTLDTGVTWDISSAVTLQTGTSITSGGVLTIDAGESYGTVITVVATTKVGGKTATVAVVLSPLAIEVGGLAVDDPYVFTAIAPGAAYVQPAAVTFDLINRSSSALGMLSFTLTGSDAASFELAENISNMATFPVGSSSFTIQPADPLSARSAPYTASLRIEDTTDSSIFFVLNLSFEVMAGLQDRLDYAATTWNSGDPNVVVELDSADTVAADLTVPAGVTLRIPDSGNLNTSSGTLTINGAVEIAGTAADGVITADAVVLNGELNIPATSGTTISDLDIASGATAVINADFTIGYLTVDANVTEVTIGGELTIDTNGALISGPVTIENGGSLIVTAGASTVDLVTATAVITVKNGGTIWDKAAGGTEFGFWENSGAGSIVLEEGATAKVDTATIFIGAGGKFVMGSNATITLTKDDIVLAGPVDSDTWTFQLPDTFSSLTVNGDLTIGAQLNIAASKSLTIAGTGSIIGTTSSTIIRIQSTAASVSGNLAGDGSPIALSVPSAMKTYTWDDTNNYWTE